MTIALQKGGRVERGALVLVGPGLEMGQSDDGVPILRIATDLDGTTVSPAAGGTGLTHVGASGMLLVSNGAELYYARLTDDSVDAEAAIAWSKLDKTGAVAADVGAADAAHVHDLAGASVTGVLPPGRGGTGLGAVGPAGTVLLSTGTAAAYGQVTDAVVAPGAAIAWSKVSKAGAVAADVGAISQAAADARYVPAAGYAAGQVPFGQAGGSLAARTLAGAGGVSVAEDAAGGRVVVGFTDTPTFTSAMVIGDVQADTLTAQTSVSVSGQLDAQWIVVTQPSGRPPISVPADAVLCPNLDADKLDGQHAAFFTGYTDALREDVSAGAVDLPFAAIDTGASGLAPGALVARMATGDSLAGIAPGAAGSVLLGPGAGALPVFGQVTDVGVAENAAIAPGKIDFTQTVPEMFVTSLTAGSVELDGPLLPSAVGISFGMLGTGAPLVDIPDGAPVCVNLDADRLDGQDGAFYLDLANATGTLPGVEALPGTGGTWSVGDLRLEGSVSVGVLGADGFSVGTGRQFNTSDDIGQLSGGNAWTNLNLFTTELDVIPAVAFHHPDDEAYRLQITRMGTLEWGDGTSARDTALYRTSAGNLGLMGSLLVGVGAPAGGVGPAVAAEEALDVTGNVKVRGYVAFDDDSTQASAAYGKTESDARYVHAGTAIDAAYLGGHPASYFTQYADNAVASVYPMDIGDVQSGRAYGELVITGGISQPLATLPNSAGVLINTGGAGGPSYGLLTNAQIASNAAISPSKINFGQTVTSISTGSIFTASLSVAGGRSITNSDDLVRLIDYNEYTNTNVFQGDDATVACFAAQRLGDTGFRFTSNYGGNLEWGTGTGTMDAGLYRNASGVLSVWGRLQVGGGRGTGTLTAINAAAALEVLSTTKGFLPPRMTTTQRDAIASPPDGLIVYNTTAGKLNLREAGTWKTLTSA